MCHTINYFDYIQAWYKLDYRSFFREEASHPATVEIDSAVLYVIINDQPFAFEQLLALDLDWQRRAWTHQELTVANQEKSIVMLDSEEMPWSKYMHAVLFMSMHIKRACLIRSPI